MLGAKAALEEYQLSEEFMPKREYKYTEYTHDEITEDEELEFGLTYDNEFGGTRREEQIFGARDALRAAGIDDEEIVRYILRHWDMTERYARNHLLYDGDFCDRVGGIV